MKVRKYLKHNGERTCKRTYEESEDYQMHIQKHANKISTKMIQIYAKIVVMLQLISTMLQAIRI